MQPATFAILGIFISVSAQATAASPAAPAPVHDASPGGGDGVVAAEVAVPDSAADTEKPSATKPGFGGWFDLDNSLGGGAFAGNAYNNNPALSTNLYLKPSYTFKAFGQTLAVTAWENLYYADILDKNAYDTRQIDWSDLRLTLSDQNIYEIPKTGIKIGGMIRGVVPISYSSRYTSLVTAIWAGVSFSKSFYGLDLSAGVLGAKEFHRFTTAQFPCTGAQEPISASAGEAPTGGFLDAFTNGICQPGEQGAPAASGTPTAMVDNVSWDLVPYFEAQYNFTSKWNLGVTIYYFDQFAYAVPVDQYSPQVVDSNGQPVAQANGRQDSLWTIASLGYNIDDHWQLGLGLWDTALPKTPDNRAFIPWFVDPYGLATNDWTMYFDVIATY